MGQKHSKDQLLYQYVVNGDVQGIQFLCKQGASLEWKDKAGRTPLVLAAADPALYSVAQALIELGANVNAYRKGRQGGTPLHYAAKEGLDQMVALLLSHGANAFVRNHDHRTPLDVARKNGRSLVVREIEGRICYFAGYIRETYGPGFSDASVPQTSSRVIWVVVVPRSPHNPPKRPKLELVIYTTPQEAEPRKILSLKRCKLKEPRFDQPSPALIIFDKTTKTRYKFSLVSYNDKQQLRRLYNACKGISQIMPASAQAAVEPWHSYLQTTPEAYVAGTTYTNPQSTAFLSSRDSFGYTTGSPRPHTWRTPSRLSPPMTPTSNAWVHESPRGRNYMGQGVAESWSTPNLSPHRMRQPKIDSSQQQTPDRFPAAESETVPSAPPVTTDTSSAKDQSEPSSCVICWEAPVEAACVPCGHVSSCMSCLQEIMAKNGVCPVCRAYIDQVVKLFNV